MTIHEERLRKVGIYDAISFALQAPFSYRDYRLENLFDVTIRSWQKHPKFVKMIAYAHNRNQDIELIFFHTTSYHKQTFQSGNRLYIEGKVQKSYGKLQIIQPKKVANYKIGRIFPQYRIAIRGDIFEKLKEKYLIKENLLQEGLPEEIVQLLLQIHYPDAAFYEAWRQEGTITGKYLDALKYAESFSYMKNLKQKRVYQKSIAQYAQDPEPFLSTLPFEPTNDQKKAIYDIYNDLKKEVAARRVIVGDVGSGKSLVMFATAFMNYPNKTFLMAPTTILADQLYQEAKKFLPKEMNIALVTSTNKDFDHNAHFFIGTHALLYTDLPQATVVMVDEQHRFGTNQRNLLKKMVECNEGSPHFFQFSATPIPRTKAMMQSALVDYSLIKEMPFQKEITTKVISKDSFKELLGHIKSEVQKGHQVLVVYPLVEESEKYGYKSLQEAKDFWMRYFDGVYVTHGKDKEKEEVLKEFREHGNILLATTVIEVGISLPRLSTIVIVGAENLGLATLHQLRGRVSRTGLKGYCFLYTNDAKNERLQKFASITNGFEIAELDLMYRKSGDIIHGREQSGKTFKWLHMALDKAIVEEAKKRLEELSSSS
ncbi:MULTISPECIES: ATP-dependent DNA helicase RecG [unclassified Nitratiruptor]|uniref:ATP-dependent DNA helicase RecG n=1 Tax=unclassified Nitratiruptor TaxID=2624044 RepID=UPI001916A166|nr:MULTISPECIES: ATP-dependent DNA helicase RecG [unclassified Nitratiruptor]BCD60664.1 ATP-dependent DNA helicase RecG [Nitratiruptor sp. YY08-10]BCD64595.1 ATP-dependent DNA helicase RecG [Nitratiruptor sp. YY08-14]